MQRTKFMNIPMTGHASLVIAATGRPSPGSIEHLPKHLPLIRNQRGATLVIALIFLLLLTIIGVTAVTTSTLQEKMAANQKDKQIAFDGAESALRDAETWLIAQPGRNTTSSSLPCGINVICVFGVPGNFGNLSTHNTSWWTTYGGVDPNGSNPNLITAPSLPPEYIIEDQNKVKFSLKVNHPAGDVFYRITATGWGATPNAVSTLQESFAKLVNN